jgi:hypothetical protein
MVINRLSVLVFGFQGVFSLVHTPLVVVSGCFGMFQDVSGSTVYGHGSDGLGGAPQTQEEFKGWIALSERLEQPRAALPLRRTVPWFVWTIPNEM